MNDASPSVGKTPGVDGTPPAGSGVIATSVPHRSQVSAPSESAAPQEKHACDTALAVGPDDSVCSLGLYAAAELLRRLEDRSLTARDAHRLVRSRVASCTGRPRDGFERPKPTELNAISLGNCVEDRLHEPVHNGLRLDLCEAGGLCISVDDVGFGHDSGVKGQP